MIYSITFVSKKESPFALLPKRRVEATDRVLNMINYTVAEGFGNSANTGAC